MEKYYEMFQQTLELLDTMSDGFKHIQTRLEEGRIEDTSVLFADILDAYDEIKEASIPSITELPENNIENKMNALEEQLKTAINIYEKNDVNEAKTLMKAIFEKEFSQWKSEIEQNLRPFVIS